MPKEILSLGDAPPHPVETIAEELGPQATGLIVGLMENSRAETDAIMDRIMEGKDTEIEQLTQERNAAWAALDRIERRVHNLLFAQHSPLDEPFYE